MNILKTIKDKDDGYELAMIGVQFGLTGDDPVEFLKAVESYYREER